MSTLANMPPLCAAERSPARPSANADWVRALQRTAAITPASTRTLARALDEIAEPSRPALIGLEASLDYAGLVALANRVAHWALGEGLRPGDRVALMMENEAAYPAIWIGLTRVGIVAALLNTQLVDAGLAHALAVADARHIIASPALATIVAEILCRTVGIQTLGVRRRGERLRAARSLARGVAGNATSGGARDHAR